MQGWYGMAKQRAPKIATLSSPFITSYTGEKCLSFYYQLNGGRHLNKKLALEAYVEHKDGQKKYLPFVKGGHHGNYWRRAAVKVDGMTQQFRVCLQ